MGRLSKALGDALKDNVNGMIKYGPSTSFTHNHGAAKAAKQERLAKEAAANTHRGGFHDPQWGYADDGRKITFALGWGNNEGHTLLADGHVPLATFKQHGNHNHYGPGDGPRNNVRDRGRYSGPGG